MTDQDAEPGLPPRLSRILEQDYPRFSEVEMRRRRELLEAAMGEADVGHVIIYGAGWRGSAVPWFTRWPVTTEAIVVLTPGMRDSLFVQYYNHVPQARRIATEAEVAWGGRSTIATAVAELVRRGGDGARVGVIGPLPFGQHEVLADGCLEVVDMNRAYVSLRLVKSAEELDWFRLGAWLGDRAIDALLAGLRPGLSERDLGDLVERAYVPLGGTTQIHFFGVTSMHAPDLCVPAQFPSTRLVRQGDVVFTEISAVFWDYSGQVLRSFAVADEPPPLYRALHETAEAAFDAICGVLRDGATPAQLVDAAAVIEEAGFTTCDDLVHGYGGGYLPPVIGSASRPAGKLPDITLRAGMMVVVQPNVITPDGKAGVQTGEVVLITDDGVERLHAAPRGFLRIGRT